MKILLILAIIIIVSLGAFYYFYPSNNAKEAISGAINNENAEDNAPQDLKVNLPTNDQVFGQQKTNIETETAPVYARVVSESDWGSTELINYYYEIGNEKWKEAYPCDASFSIDRDRLVSGNYDGGIVVQRSEEVLSEIKRNNITNKETINISDTTLTFELDEIHTLQPGVYKKICSFDGQCHEESDWIVLKINGYKTKMAQKEVKTFKLDNNLQFNLGVFAGGEDFCLKVI